MKKVSFFLEREGAILPIEIKSGKEFTKHSALDNLLSIPNYAISEAFVFHNDNVRQDGKVMYYPMYMLMFVEKTDLAQDLIYTLDLDVLR